jgi:hypothetical protein
LHASVVVFKSCFTDIKKEIEKRIKFKANNNTKYNNNLEADDQQAGLITRASSVSSTNFETPTTSSGWRKGRKKVVQTADGLIVSIRRKSTPKVANNKRKKNSLYDSSDDEKNGRANVRQKPTGDLLVYLL